MIVLIIIVIAFVNNASRLGLNKVLWGFIGAASYFGTQLLVSLIAALILGLEETTYLDRETELSLTFLSIIAGGVAAYIAYQRMPHYANKNGEIDIEDLLDQDMFR